MNANTINKAMLVHALVEQYYEPGNQSRCRLWVFMNYIKPVYPMSERTFWWYMKIAKEATYYVKLQFEFLLNLPKGCT